MSGLFAVWGLQNQTKAPPIISDDRRRFLLGDQKSQRVVTMKLRGSPYAAEL